MTTTQLANIILRILGALWIVRGLMALPQMILLSFQAAASAGFFVVGSVITSVLWVALGFVIYRKSEAVALAMFPDGETASVSNEPDRMLEMGFALLAVYLGIDAVGRVAGLLFALSRHDSWQSDSHIEYLWNSRSEDLLAASVELIACLALFLGRRGLARVARSVRSMPEDAG